MIEIGREFILRDIYEYAALVEECAQHSSSFLEIGIEQDTEIALRLQKPHKLSLLHMYIFTMIAVEQSRNYRKNSDCFADDHTDRTERIFDEYGISYIPFSTVGSEVNGDYDEPIYRWFQINEEPFRSYWEKVTDEVFHIVFSNRRFLLQFGLSLADYLDEIQGHLPPMILATNGRIKRLNSIPTWVRKAVFFRDQGRCVFCKKDLSGLLATDRQINFDHIVPLARWGTNEPSNFQLLCAACNSQKSDFPAEAGRFYVPYWEY